MGLDGLACPTKRTRHRRKAMTDLAGTGTDAARWEAILAPAVDYIESWLDGDSERMAHCLHPDLVKREIVPEPATGEPVVRTITREDMVGFTEKGGGRKHERPYDATLLDDFEDIATVRVLSSVFMDYLHVARFGDQWLIVNVLWQDRPSH
jgi:hypothetical protein